MSFPCIFHKSYEICSSNNFLVEFTALPVDMMHHGIYWGKGILHKQVCLACKYHAFYMTLKKIDHEILSQWFNFQRDKIRQPDLGLNQSITYHYRSILSLQEEVRSQQNLHKGKPINPLSRHHFLLQRY